MNQNRYTILIVDDEREICETIAAMLENDHTCEMATSVEEASKVLERMAVHIIITDLKMPRYTGVDLIRQLKRTNERVPVIMVSGYMTKQSAIEVANLGVHEILEKPVSEQQIRLSVNRALLAIQAAEHHFDMMVAKFLHEVSTPMTGILMLAQLLSERLTALKDAGELEAKQASQAERILVLAQRVRDMIRASKISVRNQGVDNRTLNLWEVVQDSSNICQYSGVLNGFNLSFTGVDRSLQVQGSPVRLSQVFINLIKNAAQANQKNRNKWIRVEAEPVASGTLVRFIDSGAGIPADVATRLFAQAFTTKSQDKGSGLGLNICRAIVEEHGGSINLDENAEHTTFVIHLPAVKPPEADPEKAC